MRLHTYNFLRLNPHLGFPLEYAFGRNAPPAPVPPNEDAVAALMGMGYGREQVIEALQLHGNDANRAAEHLLGGGH